MRPIYLSEKRPVRRAGLVQQQECEAVETPDRHSERERENARGRESARVRAKEREKGRERIASKRERVRA